MKLLLTQKGNMMLKDIPQKKRISGFGQLCKRIETTSSCLIFGLIAISLLSLSCSSMRPTKRSATGRKYKPLKCPCRMSEVVPEEQLLREAKLVNGL